MLNAIKKAISKAGFVIGVIPDKPIDDFTDNYMSIVNKSAAVRLIEGVGGWNEFVLIAESINISTSKQSVVYQHLGDDITIHMFNEHKVYLHRFTRAFTGLDFDKRGKPIVYSDIKLRETDIEKFHRKNPSKTFMHNYIGTKFEEMLTPDSIDASNNISARELIDALEYGVSDSKKGILISKWVIHSAIQVLAHDYQLYKTIN